MKQVNNSVLLVEGKDDQHVILSLLAYYNVPETFVVIDCDGIDNLLREVSLRLTTPTMYTHMGVVMDEESNENGVGERLISAPESKIEVHVIPADEEFMVVNETFRLITQNK